MIKDIPAKKVILIDNIKHQGIGGQEMILEKEATLDYLLDKNLSDMNIAERNFIERRTSLFIENSDEECGKIKIYYGHVGDLGYWICEDEIKEEPMQKFNEYWGLK